MGRHLALLTFDQLGVSRREVKSDHSGAKLFILAEIIWRPGLGRDCFIGLHSQALAVFGMD